MARFFAFIRNREYEQGSLNLHLGALQLYGGSPDFFDDAEDDRLAELIIKCRKLGEPVTITDGEYNEVVSVK